MLFAFAQPTGVELARRIGGRVPSHRLWGFCEMGALGVGAELCATPDGLVAKLGNQGWRLWQTAWILSRREAEAVVAVHEVSACFLLLLKRFGVKCPPVILINLGLLHPKNRSGVRHLFWRALLPCADAVISLVESQSAAIAATFGVSIEKCHFLPMPVETAFFKKVKPEEEKGFCLAVGTNDGKDFETLVEALPLGQELVIVTDGFNAAKIRAHRCFGAGIRVLEAVPAVELRELYRQARVVVIPLLDTPHGSGHTVLLENMAMGKILIVSDTRSMRGYVRHGENAIVVPVGDPVALRSALRDVIAHAERFASMRERAAEEARSYFEVGCFARGVVAVWRTLGRSRRGMDQGYAATKEKVNYASIS